MPAPHFRTKGQILLSWKGTKLFLTGSAIFATVLWDGYYDLPRKIVLILWLFNRHGVKNY